jgi:hypothetical protein
MYLVQTRDKFYKNHDKYLMEVLVFKKNILEAIQQVEKNKGAPNTNILMLQNFNPCLYQELILCYINSGVMVNGVTIVIKEGISL